MSSWLICIKWWVLVQALLQRSCVNLHNHFLFWPWSSHLLIWRQGSHLKGVSIPSESSSLHWPSSKWLKPTGFSWLIWSHTLRPPLIKLTREGYVNSLPDTTSSNTSGDISSNGCELSFLELFSSEKLYGELLLIGRRLLLSHHISGSEWWWNPCLAVPAKWINRKIQSSHSQITTGIYIA